MDHGGIRSGAGRPKGSVSEETLSALALKEYILDEVVKNKEPIVRALISQAKKGNLAAIKQLLDITVGKVDVSGKQAEQPPEEPRRIPASIDVEEKKLELKRLRARMREYLQQQNRVPYDG